MKKESNFKEKMLKELREDIVKRSLLLLLNANDNMPVKGRIRVMKELFLISKNMPELEEKADFEAYSYGPNSDEVSNALEELCVINLKNEADDGYTLTDSGKEIADIIKDNTTNNELEMIEDMKRLSNDLTLDELLALVYYTYPEMALKSLVKDKIGNKRERIALNLLKKGKISIGKASEIAGMPMTSFYKLLKEKGIKIGMGHS